MEYFGFYDNTSDENGSIHLTNFRNQAQLAQNLKNKRCSPIANPQLQATVTLKGSVMFTATFWKLF